VFAIVILLFAIPAFFLNSPACKYKHFCFFLTKTVFPKYFNCISIGQNSFEKWCAQQQSCYFYTRHEKQYKNKLGSFIDFTENIRVQNIWFELLKFTISFIYDDASYFLVHQTAIERV